VPPTWFHISLSAEQLAAGHLERIRDKFTDLFIAAGSPVGAAMFSTTVNRVHLENDDVGAILYLNPPAIDVAADFLRHNGAVPCLPPVNEGDVTLMVGHEGDQRLLSS
jgi:hypothetical protein